MCDEAILADLEVGSEAGGEDMGEVGFSLDHGTPLKVGPEVGGSIVNQREGVAGIILGRPAL